MCNSKLHGWLDFLLSGNARTGSNEETKCYYVVFLSHFSIRQHLYNISWLYIYKLLFFCALHAGGRESLWVKLIKKGVFFWVISPKVDFIWSTLGWAASAMLGSGSLSLRGGIALVDFLRWDHQHGQSDCGGYEKAFYILYISWNSMRLSLVVSV